MAKPQHYKNPHPGVMKFTILVNPSFVIITIYLICLIHAPVQTRRGREILHSDYMTMPQHKNTYNLVDSFLVIIILPSVCLIYAWVQRRRFLKNNPFSLYDRYDHALAQNPCPGGHEVYNFGRSFLGHHYCKLSLSKSCPKWKRISCNLTLQMLHTKFG